MLLPGRLSPMMVAAHREVGTNLTPALDFKTQAGTATRRQVQGPAAIRAAPTDSLLARVRIVR
jgi:hypothetical protein